MASLHVKFLSESAKAPTVAHPGEDIGYDLYASQPCTLLLGQVQRVHTGIAETSEMAAHHARQQHHACLQSVFCATWL